VDVGIKFVRPAISLNPEDTLKYFFLRKKVCYINDYTWVWVYALDVTLLLFCLGLDTFRKNVGYEITGVQILSTSG
jgi:hypothetical protein